MNSRLKMKGLLIEFAGFIILLISLWGPCGRGTIYYFPGLGGGLIIFAVSLFIGGVLVKRCKDQAFIKRNRLGTIVVIVIVAMFSFWYFILSDYSYFSLTHAVWLEHPTLVRLLLRLGADIGQEKARDIDGMTVAPPLLGAVMTGQDEIAEELLKRGARTDSLYSEGFGLLEWCVDSDRLETARLLLRYGADPRQETFYGTAEEVARSQGRKDFIELFSAYKKSPRE